MSSLLGWLWNIAEYRERKGERKEGNDLIESITPFTLVWLVAEWREESGVAQVLITLLPVVILHQPTLLLFQQF